MKVKDVIIALTQANPDAEVCFKQYDDDIQITIETITEIHHLNADNECTVLLTN